MKRYLLALLFFVKVVGAVNFTATISSTTNIAGSSFVYSASAPLPPPEDFNIPPAIGTGTNLWLTNWVFRTSPTSLVLLVRDTKTQGTGNMPPRFNFSNSSGNGVQLPTLSKIVVTNGAQVFLPNGIDFKRHCVYSHNEIFAPYVIHSWLTLNFTNSFADGDTIRVVNADNTVFTNIIYPFTCTFAATDFNPAIQVNQVGYAPTGYKTFNISWYGGTNLQESSYATNTTFNVYDEDGASNIYTGVTTLVQDNGWGGVQSYQKVLQGDWSAVTKEGLYTIRIANMGRSVQTRITADYPAYVARMGARGLYSQSCGMYVGPPYISLTHDLCHTGLVVNITNNSTQATLVGFVRGDVPGADGDWNAAQYMTNMPAACTGLWAYVTAGPRIIVGGYHDAGDYSIYVQNASILVNKLITSVDSYTGVSSIDNLGLPYSGDGIPDVLQLAKWQGDQLLGMQDSDGGVFSRNVGIANYYENGAPENYQQRALYPKDILPTFSFAGCMSDMGSSPVFKKFYPDAATNYLKHAQDAWAWSTQAIAQVGYTNAYRPSHFYGGDFAFEDEMCHAGWSLWIATSNAVYANFVTNHIPLIGGSSNRKWGWRYEYQAFGCAQRDIAFSVQSGRRPPSFWTPYQSNFNSATQEIFAAADVTYYRCTNNAYRIAYEDESKFDADTPYLFNMELAAPLIHGVELQKFYGQPVTTNYINMVTRSIDWDFGQNPSNKPRWGGVGQNPIRSSPSQWDRFDNKLGPPTGFMRGSMISDIHGANFGAEHEQVGWPHEYNAGQNKFSPLHERLHQDVFEVLNGECTVGENGDQVATTAWFLGMNSYYGQTPIISIPTAVSNGVTQVLTALVPGVDTSLAQHQWESYSNAVSFSRQYPYTPKGTGTQFIRVEVKMPSGLTYATTTNITVN